MWKVSLFKCCILYTGNINVVRATNYRIKVKVEKLVFKGIFKFVNGISFEHGDRIHAVHDIFVGSIKCVFLDWTIFFIHYHRNAHFIPQIYTFDIKLN